ncbi:MAG: ABC transporter ATP-binding protein [Anaerolineaceae bacterium]
MKRLYPYFKKYWRYILATVVLLLIMSNADLALPDYMSRIVNVGIQQNGIESPVPNVMRQSTMDNLAVFQTETDHALLLSAYRLADSSDPDYPANATEPVYMLNPQDKAQLTLLEGVISKPLMLNYGLEMVKNDPELAAQVLGGNIQTQLSNLPASTNLIDAIKSMPEAQRTTLLATITAQMDKLEPTMLKQMAIRAVKTEYETLGIDILQSQTNYVLNVGVTMLGLALIAVVTSIGTSYMASKTSAGVAADLRLAIFKKVQAFAPAEFDSFSTASLITRTTNDVNQLQQVIFMVMRMALMAPLLAIGGIVRAVSKSPNMWWLIALAVGLILLLIGLVFTIALPRFKLMQKLIDKLNLVTRENLSGMMVIRAFNKEPYEEARFDRANRDLNQNNLFVGRLMVTLMPLMNIIMSGLNIAIIWVGAREIAASTLQVGDMMAFMQYATTIIFSFINLSMLFIMIPRAAVSADRIADVLETPIAIQDPEEPKTLSQPVKGIVEFKDVDFRYPGAEEDVLNDISFVAQPGQMTSVIGSTGSGKSTLMNLIPRFFEVSKGKVLIDGVDVRDLKQLELRDQIGYIPQQALLFSGTIASNLQFAKPNATTEEMQEAISIAQAAEFVNQSEAGLESAIAQAGANVSGGQKQRLSIARALVKRPPIYIFDDSFSALDFKTDAALRAAIKDRVSESTVIVVTQRVATAKNSDQILVLDNGRLVGKGTHRELMQSCEIYQEIANSQLSKEELAA